MDKWKPKNLEVIYCFNGFMEVVPTLWNDNSEIDKTLYELGNCFRSNEGAKAKIEEIKAILKDVKEAGK